MNCVLLVTAMRASDAHFIARARVGTSRRKAVRSASQTRRYDESSTASNTVHLSNDTVPGKAVDEGYVVGLPFSLQVFERYKICRIASSNPPAHLVGPGRQKMEGYALLPIGGRLALSSAAIFYERVLLSAICARGRRGLRKRDGAYQSQQRQLRDPGRSGGTPRKSRAGDPPRACRPNRSSPPKRQSGRYLRYPSVYCRAFSHPAIADSEKTFLRRTPLRAILNLKARSGVPSEIGRQSRGFVSQRAKMLVGLRRSIPRGGSPVRKLAPAGIGPTADGWEKAKAGIVAQSARRCENVFVAVRLLSRSLVISSMTFGSCAASSKAKAINLISCWPLRHGTSANGCGCSPFFGFASYARSLPTTSISPYKESPEDFSGPTSIDRAHGE